MAHVLAYRCGPEAVRVATGLSGDEAATELAVRLGPALETAQRAMLAGDKGGDLVRDNEVLVDAGVAYALWSACPQTDGAVMVLLSHSILPTGVAWTPDLEDEAPPDACVEVLKYLETVAELPRGELCYAEYDELA